VIFLYSDILYRSGGIETYLHTLALHLLANNIPFRVCVAELENCPLIDELVSKDIEVYRQPRLPGDRWLIRQRAMLLWLSTQLKKGDWVFCVRWPAPQIYLETVQTVQQSKAKIAVSWALAPEFFPPISPYAAKFCKAVAQTDAVISVSNCTLKQFDQVYGYKGRVHVVPYHNHLLFSEVVPLPPAPPWKIGFMGRLDIEQKNLDSLLKAFALISKTWSTELHFYGGGKDRAKLETIASDLGIYNLTTFHGAYDHRSDVPAIMANCHFFVYPSRFEGGPCFTLLELMQAGRFCVAANVGGIPDLYENNPEAGLLIAPNNPHALAKALDATLSQLVNGEIDIQRVRDRYFNGFDMASAHQAWKLALQVVT
jgi:glycosyltransferase involved in cell wall biosynthesis